MEFTDKDPVWQLLKKAKPKKASGAFVQNVSRAVRQLGDEAPKRSWLEIFFSKPMLATAAACAIAVGMFVAFSGGDLATNPNGSGPIAEVPPAAVPAPVDVAEEFEVVTYVDELLAVSDPDELDDEALAELLFSL